MRLIRRRQEHIRPQLNMAAMVDVVFLLLIFFMCTSSISQIEHSLPGQVSHHGPGSGQDPDDMLPYIIRLERVPDGVLVRFEDRSCATFEDLFDRLRETYTLGGDGEILIKGQGTVPYGFMVATLDTCRRAGFRRVAFSTKGDDS
jgi:biopolymer transport protein ExbD